MTLSMPPSTDAVVTFEPGKGVAPINTIAWVSAVGAGSLVIVGFAVFVAGIRGCSNAATPVIGNQAHPGAGDDRNSRLELQSNHFCWKWR